MSYRPIELVRQEEGSNLCGQACVAMLAGGSLEQAVEMMGTGRTTTANIRAALGLCGVLLSMVANRISTRRPMPPTALLLARGAKRRDYHWMVWHDGQIYDPTAGVFGREDWGDVFARWRLTSCWPTWRIIR